MKVKVLIITAFGETNYIKSALETEMEAYVNKPIEIDKIEEAMKKIGIL